MTEPNILGERVLLSRRRAKLTQQELAVAAGVTATTIARLEQGRTHHISTRSLEQISRVLGVSADYLLGLSDVREGCSTGESGGRTEDPRTTPLHAIAVES
jgi:transcriptional regulator with XRE-family HTH domain